MSIPFKKLNFAKIGEPKRGIISREFDSPTRSIFSTSLSILHLNVWCTPQPLLPLFISVCYLLPFISLTGRDLQAAISSINWLRYISPIKKLRVQIPTLICYCTKNKWSRFKLTKGKGDINVWQLNYLGPELHIGWIR